MGVHDPDSWVAATQAVPVVQPEPVKGEDIAALVPVQPRSSRAWAIVKGVVIVVLLVAAILGAVAIKLSSEGTPAHSPVTWQSRRGEVWWTKNDCPVGVKAPCLDDSVSLSEVPAWAGGGDTSPGPTGTVSNGG